MVTKASEDFPDPERPVKTTSLSRGIERVTFLRLCSRAPRIVIWSVGIGTFGYPLFSHHGKRRAGGGDEPRARLDAALRHNGTATGVDNTGRDGELLVRLEGRNVVQLQVEDRRRAGPNDHRPFGQVGNPTHGPGPPAPAYM